MTEYWVSQAKFWCTFCKKFIQDNKPSRTNHDNGNLHKENVKRHLKAMKDERGKKEMQDRQTLKEIREIEKKISGTYNDGAQSGDLKSNSYGDPNQKNNPNRPSQAELEYQWVQSHSLPRPKITDELPGEETNNYVLPPGYQIPESSEASESSSTSDHVAVLEEHKVDEESGGIKPYVSGGYVDLLGGWTTVPVEEEVLDKGSEVFEEDKEEEKKEPEEEKTAPVFEEEDGSDNENRRKIGSERKAVLDESSGPVTFMKRKGSNLAKKTRNIRQKN